MMGSGKSTIEKKFPKKVALNLKDIDQLVENDQKMKIREIFKKKGKIFFRSVEENSFRTIKLPNKLSLCGGSFLNRKIRTEVLKSNIFLVKLEKHFYCRKNIESKKDQN